MSNVFTQHTQSRERYTPSEQNKTDCNAHGIIINLLISSCVNLLIQVNDNIKLKTTLTYNSYVDNVRMIFSSLAHRKLVQCSTCINLFS